MFLLSKYRALLAAHSPSRCGPTSSRCPRALLLSTYSRISPKAKRSLCLLAQGHGEQRREATLQVPCMSTPG